MVNKKEALKNQFLRDFLAIGSWIFYFLVLGRALIKPYRPFVDQIIIAGLCLILISLIIKKSDNYVSRALILVIFTTLFYNDSIFTIFAILAFLGVLISAYCLDKEKLKLFKGIFIGVICSLIAYYLGNITFNLI